MFQGLCGVCGRPTSQTCSLCGKIICPNCRDKKSGLCITCSRGLS